MRISLLTKVKPLCLGSSGRAVVRCERQTGVILLGAGFLFLLQWTSFAVAEDLGLVFVSRLLGPEPTQEERDSTVELARSGKLLVREPSGDVRVLVDAALLPGPMPVDVMDPDVSYDGQRIVFAGFSPEEAGWRIYEILADGTGLRQVTHTDVGVDLTRYGEAGEQLAGHDDLDPCYLPDGRICFVSTRYRETAPDGRRRATNLYVVNTDGSELERITTERFGADTPTVEPSTGQIVYSRWWRSAQVQADVNAEPPEPIEPGSPGYASVELSVSGAVLDGIDEEDFPGVNSWFLAGIDPDGTDMSMYSGFGLDREATQAHRPSFMASGEVLALFIPKTPFLGFPRGNGLRVFSRGASQPVRLDGPQTFPTEEDADGAQFYVASAVETAAGLVLLTGASLESEGLDYAIYLKVDIDAPPELIYNNPDTADLDAVPLEARQLPPVISSTTTEVMAESAPLTVDEAFEQGGSFTFLAENLHFNAPVDVPMPNAPPVGKRLTIEFYMGPQRTSPSAGDPPILIRRVEVPPSGRVEVDLPAGMPLFEMLRRPDDTIAFGRDGQIFHVGGFNFSRAGENKSCVGCHTGHSMLEVPEEPAWTNVATSAAVFTSSSRKAPGTAADDLFRPGNLVDRRTDGVEVEWAAAKREDTEVKLLWSTTLRGRQLTLYAPSRGAGEFGIRDQIIQGVEITTSLEKHDQQTLLVTEEIRPEGTTVALDSAVEFDTLSIHIGRESTVGLYEGEAGAALAEIEVIAQVTGEPRVNFLRGDVDCNGRLDISDPILALTHLFLGLHQLCCREAVDANSDGLLDISDAITSLAFMFLGQAQIAPPFPGCGPASTDDTTCDQPFCL